MEQQQTRKVIIAMVLVASTFLGGFGQFLFKLGLSSHSHIIFVLLIFFGILSYLISTAFYFFALSRASLSWVYSFGGLSYIFATLLAMLIEPIPALRWIGVITIAVGTALIGIS
jgi:uncharacterized membrane protein